MAMHQFPVRFSKQQWRNLEEAASRLGVPVERVICDAIDRHLAALLARRTQREQVIRAIGGFRSGMHDVSENHDAYLAVP